MAGSDDPYRSRVVIESDDDKVHRLRREYDSIAISASTTPAENERALRRMREIRGILYAMGRWT